jgi:hypothetical protein
MTIKQRIALAIALLILLAGPFIVVVGRSSVAFAGEPSAISTKVEVGFDGKARAGSWIPVTVDLENQGPDFDGEIQISDPSSGNPTYSMGPLYQSRYVSDVILPRGSHKRVTVYVPYFSAVPRIEVDLISKGKTVDSIEQTISVVGEQDLFVGVVGQRVSAWNLLTTLQLPAQGSRVEVVPLTTVGFPERPEVLEAFDIIAMGDVRAEDLSDGSMEALEGWVAGGGTLVLSGGANGKSNLKGLPEALLPVVPGDAVQLGSVSVLEHMGSEPLSASLPPTITESHTVSGRVLAQEGDMPLAVLGTYGNGRVLFLAFDPVAQPLAGWGGMPQVWEELLLQSLPSSILSGNQLARGSPLGASTQWLYNLSSAVSYLPALEIPSVNLLVGLIVAYILLVGPGSYLILRRLRRPGLAWAAIPVLVLLFSSGAYFLAVQAKGNDVQVSAATIVERTSGTDWARVRQMVGVLAPNEADYHADLPGKALVCSWDTSSGAGIGGEVSTMIRYQEDGSEAELLNMGMWTMRSLWTDSMQRVEDGLLQNLYVEGDHLKGTVSNGGTMRLKEAWLVAGGVAADLGALDPGDIANVDMQLVDAPAGLYLNSNIFNSGSSPPADPDEQRLWQQRRQVLSAAVDSRYMDLPSGVSVLLVGWTDESSPEITVNGESPTKSSLTVFIDPVTPEVRGAFSLPGGMLTGQIVDVNATMIDSAPGMLVLDSGDITYQFELPEGLVSFDRVAVQIPLSGGSFNNQDIKLLAYNWGADTWDSLDLKTVKLQSQASSSSGKTTIIVPAPVPVSPPSVIVTSPGGVTYYATSSYGIIFNELLEGEMLGQEGSSDYVSASGTVRVKLVLEDGVIVQIGTPSLALQGVADD